MKPPNEKTASPEALIFFYQALLRAHPADAAAQERLAFAYQEQGDYVRSLAAFERLRDLEPTCGNAWYNLGVAHTYLEDYEAAIQHYQKTVALAPNYADAWHNMGVIYDQWGAEEQAIACFKQLLNSKPTCSDALFRIGFLYDELENLEAASDFYQQALVAEPEDYDTLYNLANVYARQGNEAQAILYYEKASAVEEADGDAIYHLALMAYRKRAYKKTIASCERLLATFPYYGDAYTLLGIVHAKKKDYQQAIIYFQKALSIQPRELFALVHLGRAYQQLGEKKKALEVEAQLRNIPLTEARDMNLVSVFYLDGENWEAAIQLLQRAVVLEPTYYQALGKLGFAYKEKGLLEQAFHCFEQALASAPDYGYPHTSLGDLCLLQHRPASAQQHYATAWKKKAQATTARQLGHAWLLQGQPTTALEWYRQGQALAEEITAFQEAFAEEYTEYQMGAQGIAETSFQELLLILQAEAS